MFSFIIILIGVLAVSTIIIAVSKEISSIDRNHSNTRRSPNNAFAYIQNHAAAFGGLENHDELETESKEIEKNSRLLNDLQD